MSALQRFGVIFVCTGNICRSPTAHAVLRHRVAERGLADRIAVDSAGLEAWHSGQPPDPRSIRHAQRRGYDMRDLRSRQFSAQDFERADLVLLMDHGHLSAAARRCPPQHLHKLRMLAEFCARHDAEEVADPYYGGAAGFEAVLDLIEDACEGLLEHIEPQTSGQASRRS